MARIFLSYSSRDIARVRPLAGALLSLGLEVFWDRNIPAGTSWRSILDRELRNAQCVVVLWTTDAIASEWVIEEADAAKSQGKLLPVLLDHIEQPIGFRSIQAADLTGWNGRSDSPELVTLVEIIEQRLASVAEPVRRPALSTGAGSPKKARPKRTLLWATLALLTLAVGATYLAVVRKQPSVVKPGQSQTGVASSTESNAMIQSGGARRVYYENFTDPGSIQKDAWLLGKQGDWEGAVRDGSYQLCNTSVALASLTNAFSYFDLANKPVDQSNNRVEMTVALQPPLARQSAAGILLRSSRANDTYFAFALSAGASVSFIKSKGKKVSIRSTWGLNGFHDGQSVRLAAECSGKDIRLFVNDKLIDTEEDDEGVGGNPGVFALSTGCSRFDDVAVYLPKL